MSTSYPEAVAIIMATYRNDRADRLHAAMTSMVDQRELGSCVARVYLGVDGPVGAELDAVIAHWHAHPSVVVKRYDTNRGLGPILNDLIAALGDEPFVFRMDADDVSHPTRIARQLDHMLAQPDTDILGAAIVERGVEGRNRVVNYPRDHDAIVEALYWRNPIAHPTVCFRRTVLDRTGGYPVQHLSEDLAMWFLCAERGFRFTNLAEPLLDFTVDANFLQRRSVERAWREYLVWSRGVWALHGLSWRLAGPMARLAFRLAPRILREHGYASAIRRPLKS